MRITLLEIHVVLVHLQLLVYRLVDKKAEKEGKINYSEASLRRIKLTRINNDSTELIPVFHKNA